MPEFNLIHVAPNGLIRDDLKCTSCKLCESPELLTNCMASSGRVGVDFLVVGHAPGVEDDGIGKHFTGDNGRLVRALFEEAGISDEDVVYTNALKCSLRGAKPKDTYWKRCRGHFRNELREFRPKAIISFGNQALKWLTGFGGVRRFRRRGLPCVLNEDLVVYPFEQALALQHAGADYHAVRSRMVKDFMWLRQKAIEGSLHIADPIKPDYKRAESLEDVYAFLEEFPEGSEVIVDLETAGPDWKGALYPYPENFIVAIGLSNGPGHARMIPLHARGISSLLYWSEEYEQAIREAFGHFWRTRILRGHNLIQFDQKWLCVKWGLDSVDIRFEQMLAGHLLDEEPGGLGLEDMAMRYTKMMPWKKKFTVRDIVQCCRYLAFDVDANARIAPIIEGKLSSSQLWLHDNIQVPLAHEARRMEQRGVRIDVEAINRLDGHLIERIAIERKAILSTPEVQAWQLKNTKEFNPDSPHDLRDLLENYFKLECIKRTETGLYSTDASVLEHWEDQVPFLSHVLTSRRATKLKGTYVDNIKERIDAHGDIIHYSIKLHGTVTGRPSFENPNVGNIPRADTAAKAGIEDPKLVKSIFVPRKTSAGTKIFLQGDYSQAELRTLAIYSDDANLKQAYFDDIDVHSATAAQAYGIPIDEFLTRLDAEDPEIKGMRSNAKIINFGIIYGKSEESLQRDFIVAARTNERKAAKKAGRPANFTPQMEQEAMAEAQTFIAMHKKAYPDVWRWLHAQEAQIRAHGYQETKFGRRRHYHKIDNAAIRQAYNFPIQSTAADFTHVALVRCAKVLRELGIDAYPVLTVYDSIIFECTSENMWEVAEIVLPIMENLGFPWMTVPMKVDLEAGLSWGKLKKLDLKNRCVAA